MRRCCLDVQYSPMSLRLHEKLLGRAALVVLGLTQVPTALSTLETWDVLGRQVDLRELPPVASDAPFELERAPHEPEAGCSTESVVSAESIIRSEDAVARVTGSRSVARTDARSTLAGPPYLADANDGIDEEPTIGPPLRHYRLRAETGYYTMTMGNGAGRKGPGPDEPESEHGTGQAQAAKAAAATGVTVLSGVGIAVSSGGIALSIAEEPGREDKGPDEPEIEYSTAAVDNARSSIGPEDAITRASASRSLVRSGAPSAVVEPTRPASEPDEPETEYGNQSVASNAAAAAAGTTVSTGRIIQAELPRRSHVPPQPTHVPGVWELPPLRRTTLAGSDLVARPRAIADEPIRNPPDPDMPEQDSSEPGGRTYDVAVEDEVAVTDQISASLT